MFRADVTPFAHPLSTFRKNEKGENNLYKTPLFIDVFEILTTKTTTTKKAAPRWGGFFFILRFFSL